MTEPSAEVLSRRERLACNPPDPCACDNTCRNHKFLAELEDLLAGKDRLIRLQAAALDVWKTAHPHEQSPGACARALAEKDAALAHMTEVAQHNADAEMARSAELSSLLAWARMARERIEQDAIIDHELYGHDGPFGVCCGMSCDLVRALLARAPEGVKE